MRYFPLVFRKFLIKLIKTKTNFECCPIEFQLNQAIRYAGSSDGPLCVRADVCLSSVIVIRVLRVTITFTEQPGHSNYRTIKSAAFLITREVGVGDAQTADHLADPASMEINIPST